MGAVSSINIENVFSNKLYLNNIIEEIRIAAERLNRLVINLLDMTRLESGNLNIKSDWNSVSDLVHSSLEKLKNEIGNHKIKTEIDDDIVMKFDFILLEQALINILHNSLSYTHDTSEIIIEGKKQNKNLILKISDNGPGFDEEHLQNLFHKFFRLPGTKTGGSGLGLSISKGFIEAHGGTISASNKVGGGAIFIITLPIKE